MNELLRRRGSQAAVIASLAAYILAFRFLHDVASPVVDALAILPVVIAAWSFGPAMVVATSLLVGLISALALVGVGTEPNAAMRSAFIAATAFAVVGAVLSYARQSQRIDTPFRVAGTEVRLESRVAVARHPDHADTALELVRRVEMALDDAKFKGRSAVIATARSEQERLSRLETFAGLRAAIANGELRLHYQPIVELPHANVIGVEALLRWQHPQRGLVAPGEFIPVAEQSGLIVPLTKWVLNEALRQSRVWSDAGRPTRVAVNIGAKTLTPSAQLPT